MGTGVTDVKYTDRNEDDRYVAILTDPAAGMTAVYGPFSYEDLDTLRLGAYGRNLKYTIQFVRNPLNCEPFVTGQTLTHMLPWDEIKEILSQ